MPNLQTRFGGVWGLGGGGNKLLLVIYYLLLLLVCCQIVGKVLKIKSCIEVFDEFFCFSSAVGGKKGENQIRNQKRRVK